MTGMSGGARLPAGWNPKEAAGAGARPQGFPAQPSTPRQPSGTGLRTAAHYSMAFGHGAKWTDSYTLARGGTTPPWEPWQLTQRARGTAKGPQGAFIPRLAGNEEGGFGRQDARMLGSKEQQISA